MAPETPNAYTGDDPEIELDMLESGAGLEIKLQEQGYHFDSQRLYRPKEDNPLIEAKNFFLLAQAKFYSLKDSDATGEADDQFRMTSFHSIYAFLRQSFLISQENGDYHGLSLQDIEKLYLEVKTYELNGCRMDDDKRQSYLQSLDMTADAYKHMQQQAGMAIYDSFLSSRIATEGFDIETYEHVLFEYLIRSLPHITELKIVHDFGKFRLQIKSSKPITNSETQIIFALEDDVNLIAKIGEIHNNKFDEERENLTLDEKKEVLKIMVQLAKNLHGTHPPTNAHNDRFQKFWAKFVKDPILALAPLLHDCGKIGVNLDILDKPAGLNTAERRLIEDHPTGTAFFLANGLGVKDFDFFTVLCSSHHMNYAFETASYPCYLPGNQITDCPGAVSSMLNYRSMEEAQHLIDMEIDENKQILIRLFALMDIIEAMTSNNREYRSPEEKDAAIRYIRSKAGLFFEPDVASWMIEQVKNGKFDDELIVSKKDTSSSIKAPIFYSGGDVLAFLEEHRNSLEDKYTIVLDQDISRLQDSMDFPEMQLSGQLVRSNIYKLFQNRENNQNLGPDIEKEVDKIFENFVAWMKETDRAPKPARPITVETALANINEQAMAAVS